jgi:FtsH-binding integral membrane protein
MLCACENPVIQWRTFYVTLRWIVCMSAIVNAWLGLRMSNLPYTNKSVWRIFMIVFGIITLLFNPIIPVHLSRDIWEWIDVFTAVIFFLSLFFLPDKDLYTKK